jgi:hypothetical protein
MFGNILVAERLMASEEGLSCMGLGGSLRLAGPYDPRARALHSHRREDLRAGYKSHCTLRWEIRFTFRPILTSGKLPPVSAVQDACWCLCKGVGQKSVCD